MSRGCRTRALYIIFAAVTAAIAVVMTSSRLDRRNVILDRDVAPGPFGGRFFEEESGQEVVYRTRNLGAALAVSLAGGSVSGLLGIGGGILQVPALNAWCGAPLRAAAATSTVMIGVTRSHRRRSTTRGGRRPVAGGGSRRRRADWIAPRILVRRSRTRALAEAAHGRRPRRGVRQMHVVKALRRTQVRRQSSGRCCGPC